MRGGAPYRQSTAEVFVSDALEGVVDGYDQATGTLVTQLTGFDRPQGLASDASGNIYVADSGTDRVLVFAPGAMRPFLTLDDSGWSPTGVAVAADGEVAVTNNTADTGPGGPSGTYPGSVVFYQRGRRLAFRELDGPPFAYPYFCAYDAHGDLYFDAVDLSARTSVLEVIRRSRGVQTKNLGIRDIRFPGGVQVDGAGELLVLDQASATINRYAPSSGHLSGRVRLAGAGDPISFALVSTGGALYGADAVSGAVLEYAFPSGGAAIQRIGVGGLPVGIAVTPWFAP
jgi:DNA-binding beta-propeller fold protein YncE